MLDKLILPARIATPLHVARQYVACSWINPIENLIDCLTVIIVFVLTLSPRLYWRVVFRDVWTKASAL